MTRELLYIMCFCNKFFSFGDTILYMRLCPLFSGSSGNCIYIEFSKNCAFLIDVGKSNKQLENSFKINNIDPKNIKAIFITHEHSDHVAGLRVFLKNHDVKIYGSEGTLLALQEKGIISRKNSFRVLKKSETDLDFCSVKPFSISHDCKEGFGYSFLSSKGKKVSVCTDLGYISDEIKNDLKGSDTVILESNHDTMMLQNGPYPYYLKRRILSEFGHLSNDSCGKLLPYLVNSGTKNVLLSHLSAHNNLPDLALQTSLNYLLKESMAPNEDFYLNVAPKENTGNVCVEF